MMSVPVKQSWLLLARSAPYGGNAAASCLDLILTAAAFEQDVVLVFRDGGVFQLLRNQATAAADLKNIAKGLSVLELYEVTKVYVHRASCERLGLCQEDLISPVAMIEDPALRDLMEAADQVFVF